MQQEKHIPGCGSRLKSKLILPVEACTARRAARAVFAALACACLLAGMSYGQQLSASLLGVVTGNHGQPEPGALVLLKPLLRNASVWRRTTGPGGTFLIPSLPPGLYWLQAGKGHKYSAPRRLLVRQGESVLLTLRLSPATVSSRARQDEYRWVLRADAVRRPILRYRNGRHAPAAENSPGQVNGTVSMLAGSGSTAFSMPSALNTSVNMHTLSHDMLLGFSGSVGSSGWNTGSELEASLTPQLHGWYRGAWQVAIQHIATPVLGHLPQLDLFTLNYSNQTSLSRRIELQYGLLASDLSGTNSLHQLSPYMRLSLRLGPGKRLEYRYAAAPPPVMFLHNRMEFPNPAPRISLSGGAPELERGQHQEVAFFSSVGPADEIELAWFYDRFHHAVINGAWRGSLSPALLSAGNVLPDSYANLFSADGGSYAGSGFLALFQHQLSHGLSLSLGAEDGPALMVHGTRMSKYNPASLLAPAHTLSFSARVAGELGPTHTRIVCSYRTAARRELTSTDPYDSAGEASQPFANLQLRQPLPRIPFAQGRVEAMVEVQNLLAQGYVPVVTPDGHLLFLIQAARALRGGLSFNF